MMDEIQGDNDDDRRWNIKIRSKRYGRRHRPRRSISNLYNTGVDNNHVILPRNAVDPHYTHQLLGQETWEPLTVQDSDTFNGLVNDSLSQWLHPNTTDSFLVKYEFDLTGYSPSTVILHIRFSPYSFATSLNGNSLGGGYSDQPGWRDELVISSGFVPGMNTLIFSLYNTNFRMEVTGSGVTS
jgi:hypothetical protein